MRKLRHVLIDDTRPLRVPLYRQSFTVQRACSVNVNVPEIGQY
jgi:hypothetical protein